MKKLLILSTSTVHGKAYLSYCKEAVQSFFAAAKNILFVPFARPSGITHDDYTNKAAEAFETFGFTLKGVHSFSSHKEAFAWANGVFIGGGNTFLLLDQLYKTGLFTELKKRVEAGLPYMGTSAGSNITGLTISTTNDMPIIYPESFDAFAFIPFNLNPHYLDPDLNSKHMGETRETRINEFHKQHSQSVIGLREGSWIHVENGEAILKGDFTARLFRQGKAPKELPINTNLLKEI